jgi:Skp family chaperone for outer membrane proteins
MMKRSFYLSFAAIIAVAVACNEPSAESTEESKPAPKEVNTGTMKFAYVNTDSLSMQFAMIKDFEEEILQERLQMESQLEGMVRGLEKDYADAQQGASQLSQDALNILQQKLAQREQQVMQQKNAMENQLMRSEQDKTERYLDRVQSFLDEYAKAEGYDIIYGFNGLNNVLYIDEAYDITEVIVDSLNNTYESEKLQASK